MPPFVQLGSLLDRFVLVLLTFAAVGHTVLGVFAFGEPFAWSLLTGLIPLLYPNAVRSRGLAAWALLVLLPFELFDGSVIVRGLCSGFIAAALWRSGLYMPLLAMAAPGRANHFPVSLGHQLILLGGTLAAWRELGSVEWMPWLALGLFLSAWFWCWRPALEIICEGIVRLMYTARWRGPGTRSFPPRGGVLVIANHGCWFDPMFLGKLLPRPMKPMMTSRYFDIWYLRPILKYLFRVIVVPDVERRREAPELKDAAAALRDGECIILFPEGYLRRSEDKPLRRFGQGAWQILRECPDVPVIPVWIEGAWGSWCSYKDGPPTVNKPRDWFRPIQVGVAEPVVIPPEILADQMKTRFHLMNLVSAARVHVGLEPLPTFELPAGVGRETEGDGN